MNIMVCYDDSRVAYDALVLAGKHAAAYNAGVYLVSSMVGGQDMPRKKISRAEQKLADAERTLVSEGINCEYRLLVRGLSPGEDLVQFAEENDVAEIFIGVKRRSKVGKMLFGSTAQYVILNAPCPVVTIR